MELPVDVKGVFIIWTTFLCQKMLSLKLTNNNESGAEELDSGANEWGQEPCVSGWTKHVPVNKFPARLFQGVILWSKYKPLYIDI